MKQAHLLPIFSLNLKAPFCTSAFTSKILIPFLNVYTKEEEYLSVMHTMYTSPLKNKNPFYTHISSCMI